ncbi:50S ribosomal protein L24 [Neolewinella antarctica]|uniref:Large ribosomal subunit protein uL24 n=1 Tax=Neolewinella antarctica TaxID=442734 RepID=A0ABX0X8E2_9BACT|nr:large subunit ribosomal protein L24 [Neolewinella antarctica]
MANKTYKDKQKRHAPKLKIKKGDRVVVIAGANRDLALPREVLQVLPTENRAIVEGVNLRKKHQRATETDQGGIVEKAASIHISNLMLLNADDQPTRVGRKADENGKLVRFGKRDGNILK